MRQRLPKRPGQFAENSSKRQRQSCEQITIWLIVEQDGEVGGRGTPTEESPNARVVPFPARAERVDYCVLQLECTVLPPGEYEILSDGYNVTARNVDTQEVHQLNWSRNAVISLRRLAQSCERVLSRQ